MTRNQSAPHFAVSQRNYSTTFGLPRYGERMREREKERMIERERERERERQLLP